MKSRTKSLVIVCTIVIGTGLSAADGADPSAALQDLVDRNPGLRFYAHEAGPVSVYGRPIVTGAEAIEYLDIPFAATRSKG